MSTGIGVFATFGTVAGRLVSVECKFARSELNIPARKDMIGLPSCEMGLAALDFGKENVDCRVKKQGYVYLLRFSKFTFCIPVLQVIIVGRPKQELFWRHRITGRVLSCGVKLDVLSSPGSIIVRKKTIVEFLNSLTIHGSNEGLYILMSKQAAGNSYSQAIRKPFASQAPGAWYHVIPSLTIIHMEHL
jgi:hypothetical protein